MYIFLFAHKYGCFLKKRNPQNQPKSIKIEHNEPREVPLWGWRSNPWVKWPSWRLGDQVAEVEGWCYGERFPPPFRNRCEVKALLRETNGWLRLTSAIYGTTRWLWILHLFGKTLWWWGVLFSFYCNGISGNMSISVLPFWTSFLDIYNYASVCTRVMHIQDLWPWNIQVMCYLRVSY